MTIKYLRMITNDCERFRMIMMWIGNILHFASRVLVISWEFLVYRQGIGGTAVGSG